MARPNAIHALLDAAAIPWRDPRAALAARYGIQADPWYGDRPLIFLDPGPNLLGGLMRPITIDGDPRYAPDLPATILQGLVRPSGDALFNLGTAAASLAAMLGPGRRQDYANTRGWTWQDGDAAVRLTCWPPELQQPGLGNSAHEREPRLVTACHLTIATGWRPQVTPGERAALDTFEGLGRLGPGNAQARIFDLDRQVGYEAQLEFIREPGADLERIDRRVGLSRQRSHLIFDRGQLQVIPVHRILRFERLHLRPARGGGMTALSVYCATGRPEWPEKQIDITTALDLAETEALADRLSDATGRPVERTEGIDD